MKRPLHYWSLPVIVKMLLEHDVILKLSYERLKYSPCGTNHVANNTFSLPLTVILVMISLVWCYVNLYFDCNNLMHKKQINEYKKQNFKKQQNKNYNWCWIFVTFVNCNILFCYFIDITYVLRAVNTKTCTITAKLFSYCRWCVSYVNTVITTHAQLLGCSIIFTKIT